MNKIIVNKESYNLQDEEIEIINKSSNLVLNVFGNVVINDFNDNQDSKLIINVNEDSKLTINRFNSNINKISTLST